MRRRSRGRSATRQNAVASSRAVHRRDRCPRLLYRRQVHAVVYDVILSRGAASAISRGDLSQISRAAAPQIPPAQFRHIHRRFRAPSTLLLAPPHGEWSRFSPS